MNYEFCTRCPRWQNRVSYDWTNEKAPACECKVKAKGIHYFSTDTLRNTFLKTRDCFPFVRNLLFDNLEVIDDIENNEHCVYYVEHMMHDFQMKKFRKWSALQMTRYKIMTTFNGQCFLLKKALLVLALCLACYMFGVFMIACVKISVYM